MMNDPEKSDSPIVATKPTNKPGRTDAESVEPRGGAKGITNERRTTRTPSRTIVLQGPERVRERAKAHRKEWFTALLHHVDVDLLSRAYFWLKKNAAPGIDGLTWEEYGKDLGVRIDDLHGRVHRGAYRAQPSRRQFILKPDGKQRPFRHRLNPSSNSSRPMRSAPGYSPSSATTTSPTVSAISAWDAQR